MRIILQPLQTIPAATKVTGLPERELWRGCKDGTVPHVWANGTYYVDIPALWDKLDAEQQSVNKENDIRFNRQLETHGFNEVARCLRAICPRIERTQDQDLIAVNNGIFDFKKKELLPFDPKYVFLSKSHVDYDPNAANVHIHNDDDGTDWDVESWMEELSDDHEIVDLNWEILSANVRPFVRWNRSAWFYSEVGNNGKGSLCVLMRGLCGESAVATIPISDFGKDFMLEPLTRATAIIVDENDVGTYIDKAANLKATVTGDTIRINRKFLTPISYRFFGFMVQCVNEMPRVKDKSDSWYRRQLIVPFDKCFTGQERKYIKGDYLRRPEVLRYVLYRVLNMNHYELSEPAACKALMQEYKEFNDPVQEFYNEFFDDEDVDFAWDLLPFDFLYALYKAWFGKNCPSGTISNKSKFTNDIVNACQKSKIWGCDNARKTIRPGNHNMDRPEPLIVQYDLDDWKNPNYTGSDPKQIAMPALKANYRGLERREDAPKKSP